jgi:hypothetical protein
MTTVEVKSTIKRHRPAAYVGGAVGLAILIGWFAYNAAMTPAKPIIQTAKAAEVIEYVSNDRGLNSLAQIEQQHFLEQWKSHVMQEGPKQELKTTFESLDEEQRKRFVTAMTRHFKRAFMDDAKHFAQLTQPTERNKFIRERLQQYAGEGVFLKDVAKSFKNDFRGGPDEMKRWFMENTTPEERAIGEPYADALKRVNEQVRQQERAPKPPTTSANAQHP